MGCLDSKVKPCFSCFHPSLFGLPHHHQQLQPATVSRCGMIFMEPSQLGWEPLVISWINTLPKPLQGSEYRTLLLDLFHWLLPPTLRVLRKTCRVNKKKTATDSDFWLRVIEFFVCLRNFLFCFEGSCSHQQQQHSDVLVPTV